VKFIKEMFKCEISGKCERFQSVAGCGIKCVVSHVDDLLKNGNKSDFVMNYQNHIRLYSVVLIQVLNYSFFLCIHL